MSRKKIRSNETFKLETLYIYGFTFALFFIGILGVVQRLQSLPNTNIATFVEVIALSIVTLLLFIAWAISARIELNFFKEHFEYGASAKMGVQPFVVVSGLAVIFGLLLYFSDKLLNYAFIMVTYNLFDLWSTWLVQVKVKSTIQLRIDEAAPAERTQLIAFLNYYVDRPNLQRITTIMFFNFVALCLALASSYETESKASVLLGIGYLVIIVNILAGEFVIWKWRRAMYRILDDMPSDN